MNKHLAACGRPALLPLACRIGWKHSFNTLDTIEPTVRYFTFARIGKSSCKLTPPAILWLRPSFYVRRRRPSPHFCVVHCNKLAAGWRHVRPAGITRPFSGTKDPEPSHPHLRFVAPPPARKPHEQCKSYPASLTGPDRLESPYSLSSPAVHDRTWMFTINSMLCVVGSV